MNVWLGSGRKAIMLSFCYWADRSWSSLADGTIAFIYAWNFESHGTSYFCFLCTCFLWWREWCLLKYKVCPRLSREKGSCQKNLPIPHASYLVMLPSRSTKKEDRHSAGKNKLKTQQTELQENEREDPPYDNVKLFHKYASCSKKGNV